MPLKYFQSYSNYFWQWEENAEVIGIPNGNTISYKSLVVDIIGKLADQGLPLFGSLLLTLIALNPRGKKDLILVEKMLKEKDDKTIQHSESTNLKDAFSFLKRLSEISEIYKTGDKKIILLRAIFEDCHYILSRKESAKIAGLYLDSAQAFLNESQFRVMNISYHPEIKVIATLNKKFPTLEDIIQKIASLPSIEKEVILEENEEPTDYIESLISNPKTHKVGALVKTIWSGLSIPFKNVSPSQQPIGGVSDLTNKGDLSQLLISEFANDNLVFLSRLANNEALYLSRESPPSSNEMKRIILIDSSMRNWGTPKIISFATMLAIAKHPKNKMECEVFAVGKTVQSIPFDSIHELIEGLQIAEATLDASVGLEAFFKSMTSSKNQELFLLTEKSTLQQEAMSRTINEFGNQINYLILNDANGKIDIYKKLNKSRKHIQHLEIPLQKLWKKKRKSTKKRKPTHQDYYPILVHPSHVNRGITRTENGEVFQITRDKTLLRFFDKDAKPHAIGWEIIYENVPISINDFEVGILESGDIVLLTFNHQVREVRLLNVRTKVMNKIRFEYWKSRNGQNFAFHNQQFYHSNYNGCWSIDIEGKINSYLSKSNGTEIFAAHTKRTADVYQKHSSNRNILKNLKTVGINNLGRLVFNNHELLVNIGNHIKLNLTRNLVLDIDAKFSHDNFFEFNDGSTIEMKKIGLIILKSSDEKIPTIYLPSVLDMSLGIATDTAFAGSNYFYNEPLYEIILNSFGKNKLKVVSLVKKYTDMGLRDAKLLVENAPNNLMTFFKLEKATQLKKSLEQVGASVLITTINPTFQPLKKIAISTFWGEYIEEFVNTIEAYED